MIDMDSHSAVDGDDSDPDELFNIEATPTQW